MPDDWDPDVSSVRDRLSRIEWKEKESHGRLVARNINILMDILASEHLSRNHSIPIGCPRSLPSALARKREKSDSVFPCSFEKVQISEDADISCKCGDPLIGSQDPLDAVAAVVLGSEEREGAQRYFDREWREVVAKLRNRIGDWESIQSLEFDEFQRALEKSTNRAGIGRHRINRLQRALRYISGHRYTDGPTLTNLPSVEYSRLADFLRGCPGVSESDAWWLVLTAFDKPIWPSDPRIDTLLADMGLISEHELDANSKRRDSIEEIFTKRQLPALHRLCAAHALKSAMSWCGESCEIRKFSLSYRSMRQEENPIGPKVVDLFSGAGGLSHAFATSGGQIEFAIDKNRVAVDTYRLNHPEIPHDRIHCEEIDAELDSQLKNVDDIDILIGGPPCQSLSQAGYRARLAKDEEYSILDDPRTRLYQSYVDMVERFEPTMLLMENVEGIINEIGESEVKVLDQIIEALSERGYTCYAELLDSSNFGLPQQRERVFMIGIKDEFAPTVDIVKALFETLRERSPDGTYNLQQGLSGLPRLCRGEGGDAIPHRSPGRPSQYVRENQLHSGTRITLNHKAREHPMEKDQELFDSVMEPGDTGWDVKFEKGRDDLIEYDVGTEDNPRFMDKYRMLYWDEPSPTVVAHLAKDANNFVIPDYYRHVKSNREEANGARNRGVTQREAARLQSFPDDYIFLGPYTDQFRQIGNAVPPVLGRQLAEVMIESLRSINQISGYSQSEIDSLNTAASD